MRWTDVLARSEFEVEERALEDHAPLQRARHFVESRLHEPLTLTTVAGVAGLERSHFSRIFHEKVGITYRDWVSVLRVARAVELMRAMERPLSEVAKQAGFRDMRTFQRTFKKWIGRTPSQFKQQIRP